MIGAVVAIAGPGAFSIDHALEIDTMLDGIVGAGLAAGGLIAPAAQPAVFYRPSPR